MFTAIECIRFFSKDDKRRSFWQITAKAANVKNELRKFIHEIKADLGMKAKQNFSYEELVKLAEELAELMK